MITTSDYMVPITASGANTVRVYNGHIGTINLIKMNVSFVLRCGAGQNVYEYAISTATLESFFSSPD
jgi:hypothetical protein